MLDTRPARHFPFGMLAHGGSAARSRARGLAARVAILLLALAQPLWPALAAEPAPTASAHREHLAAESGPGCQTYHDAHCLVCRVLSADAAGGAAPPSLRPGDPGRASAGPAAGDRLPTGGALDSPRARAPPLG